MPNITKLKRISLEAAAKRVKRAEDKYVNKKGFKDKGIEPRIRPLVIALVAHGFPTSNSCEGHLESTLYPWINFKPATKELTKPALLQHVQQIRYEVNQLRNLLYKFYQKKGLPTSDRELVIDLSWNPRDKCDDQVVEEFLTERKRRYVSLPTYDLICRGARMLFEIPSEILEPYKEKILENRREDMQSFADFLVDNL